MPPQQFSCGFYFWYVVEGEWRRGSSWNDAISCPIQIPNLGRLSTHTATNEKKSSSYHSYPFKNNTRAPGPIEQGRRTIASVCLLLHTHTDTRSRSSLVVDPSLYVYSYALNDSWLFDRWKPVGAFGLGFRRRCAIMKNSLHWPAAQMPTVGTARNVPGIEIICDHGYCLLLFIYLFIYLFVCLFPLHRSAGICLSWWMTELPLRTTTLKSLSTPAGPTLSWMSRFSACASSQTNWRTLTMAWTSSGMVIHSSFKLTQLQSESKQILLLFLF